MAFFYDNKDAYSSNQDYRYMLNSKCGTKTDSRFFMARQLGILTVFVSRLQSDAPHSVGLSGRLIGPSQRPQPNNT